MESGKGLEQGEEWRVRSEGHSLFTEPWGYNQGDLKRGILVPLSQWKSGTKVKPSQILPGRFRAPELSWRPIPSLSCPRAPGSCSSHLLAQHRAVTPPKVAPCLPSAAPGPFLLPTFTKGCRTPRTECLEWESHLTGGRGHS